MQKTASTVNTTILAWDMYCSGKYNEILGEFPEDSPELNTLKTLARLELGSNGVSISEDSIFASLAAGTSAYYQKDYKMAAELLGAWLLEKNYFARIILQRFLDAGLHSENYTLLYAVSKKFFQWKNYSTTVIEPLFLGAFHTKKYHEAIRIFEQFRSRFRSVSMLQKVAFALLHSGRSKDAETLLLSLYEKITGQKYNLNYEEVKAEYSYTIKKIPDLEKRVNRSTNETWQLGMAYLFNEQFENARLIFESILKAA